MLQDDDACCAPAADGHAHPLLPQLQQQLQSWSSEAHEPVTVSGQASASLMPFASHTPSSSSPSSPPLSPLSYLAVRLLALEVEEDAEVEPQEEAEVARLGAEEERLEEVVGEGSRIAVAAVQKGVDCSN